MQEILDSYDVMLVDMHRTFMFGVDRFETDQDFHVAYRDNGGRRLSAREVNRLILETNRTLFADYQNPARYESFPSLADRLAELGAPESEIDVLTAAYATHERGVVPQAHAGALRALAERFRLAIVSNIFAPKKYWCSELGRAGLDGVFECFIASSDYEFMKPSPKIFQLALAHFGLAAERVVHVGDSFRCDVEGAASAGIDAIWINEDAGYTDDPCPPAKAVVPSLLSLVDQEVSRGSSPGE